MGRSLSTAWSAERRRILLLLPSAGIFSGNFRLMNLEMFLQAYAENRGMPCLQVSRVEGGCLPSLHLKLGKGSRRNVAARQTTSDQYYQDSKCGHNIGRG